MAGLLVNLQPALDSTWTAHGKLEGLRLVINMLRDREIFDARRWRELNIP